MASYLWLDCMYSRDLATHDISNALLAWVDLDILGRIYGGFFAFCLDR